MLKDIKDLAIIGFDFDMGAGVRGTRLGPEAMRIAGLAKGLKDLGYKLEDLGDLGLYNGYNDDFSHDLMKNYDRVLEATERLYQALNEIEDALPIVLGGDHSLVLASMKAALENYENPGIIYFDAHADINTTSTSPSGNIHGMPLSMLMGLGDENFAELCGNDKRLKAENIVFIGVSDLDEGEIEFLKDNNIRTYSIDKVHDMGIGAVCREAASYLNERCDGVHVSFDVDVMDPAYAKGTGINLPGGLTYREARLAMREMENLNKLTSVDMVEVNPLTDKYNSTAKMADELLYTLLGKRTY